jgi:hypothetical protein
MEQRNLARNVVAHYRTGQSPAVSAEQYLRTQVAALEATIAYCQTARQRYGEQAKTLQAICSELQLRKTQAN